MEGRKLMICAVLSFSITLLFGCDLFKKSMPECVNVSGEWNSTENLVVTCTIGGKTETNTVSQEGKIFIKQKDCSISFDVVTPAGTFTRKGEIKENKIHFENPFVVANSGNASFTKNTATADGVFTPDPEHVFETMTFTGSGIAEGTIDGDRFSCTGNTNVRFTRRFVQEEVIINVTTFIPAPYIRPPLGDPCGAGDDVVGVFHVGDSRIDNNNGKPLFDSKASSFRTRQVVAIFSNDSVVNPNIKGPAVGVLINETGQSKEYAWDALADGKIDPSDNDYPNLNDCHLLNRQGKASTERMKVDSKINNDIVTVRLYGGANDPLVKLGPIGAPNIDWDFTFTIDFSTKRPYYKFTGAHDGFPAYEVYINEKLIYPYDPGPQRCTVRLIDPRYPDRMTLLIPPLPDYCFDQVSKLFPFLDVVAKPDSGDVPRLMKKNIPKSSSSMYIHVFTAQNTNINPIQIANGTNGKFGCAVIHTVFNSPE